MICFYVALYRGFSGFIQGSSDILFAELYAVYKGFLLAKDMSVDELVCYSDSLHCVNLINGPQIKFHIYALCGADPRYKGVALSNQCFSLSYS
jgi:hypothetical protein